MKLKHGRLYQLCSYVDSAMQHTQMELIQLVNTDVRDVVMEQTDTHTPYMGTLNDDILRLINFDIST